MTPRHRSTAHSWAAAATIMTWANGRVTDAQGFCRDRAEQWERRAASATGFEALLAIVMASLWRFASGFFAGVQGGYVSHQVLDARTPAGLPLIA